MVDINYITTNHMQRDKILEAANIGTDYKVEITSLLNRNGRTPPFVDFDGRVRAGTVGAMRR